MPKSRDAFRTISEVAEWLETPAHVLRFWESKFTQVKPVKRAGGRRYYRPSDMELLSGIKKLLHDDGMTIKGVQKVLREQGVRHVSALSVQQVESDEAPEDALIEDAPYVEVPLAEETESVIPYPSRPEIPTVAHAEPEAATPPPAETGDAVEPVQEEQAEAADLDEAGDRAAKAPEMADLSPESDHDPEPEAQNAPQPDPEIEPERVSEPDPEIALTGGEAKDETPQPLDHLDPIKDLFGTTDSPELPLDLFGAAESAPAAEEEAQAPPETISPEQLAPPEPVSVDATTPELAAPALASDETEAEEPGDIFADPPVAEENSATAEIVPPAPDPAPVDAPKALAAQTRTRPLDLPDFDAPPPAPEPAAPVESNGPLGYLAKITALSPEKKRLVSAHLPALRALCDSRAQAKN